MSGATRQVCFVDMPFGKKIDPKSQNEIDFDQVYARGIRPAIEKSGLQSIRGDQEESGGIIHRAMFARLLLSEYVVADMTTANPNVFYELGIRHTARPHTTIPIFATVGAPPFDVHMVRAIPYQLVDGKLTEEAARALIEAVGARIAAARQTPDVKDSPLFDLFPEMKSIEVTHQLTDIFWKEVKSASDLRDALRKARDLKPTEAALAEISRIERSQGDPRNLKSDVLIDIFLSYRAVQAWDKMIALFDAMPANVQRVSIARQQLALALNRRHENDDRKRALEVLSSLLRDEGESAETRGIQGRIYKDLYREEHHREDGDFLVAAGWLNKAIEAYTRGFLAEPMDYYPGINAITLLLEKGDEEAIKEAERLEPLVAFAAARQGGTDAKDYWTVATAMELACVRRDYPLAMRCLPNAGVLANEFWMLETTADNLDLIARRRAGESGVEAVADMANALRTRAQRLKGE